MAEQCHPREHRRCRQSLGGARMRPVSAWTCSLCAYSVCQECYAEHSSDCKAASSTTTGIPCHICRQPKALLAFDDVPPFPWYCEGYWPKGRTAAKDGGMYSQAAVQKYHSIRSIRESRSRCEEPLTVTLVQHSTTPSSTDCGAAAASPRLASTGTIRLGGRTIPTVVRGSSFCIALRNPGLPTELVWCARAVLNSGDDAVGTATGPDDPLVILQKWNAPATVDDFPDHWRYMITVPYRFRCASGVTLLELRRIADVDSGGGAEEVPTPTKADSGRRPPPLVAVAVLHHEYVSTRDVSRESTVGSVPRSFVDERPIAAVEVSRAVDLLLQGRSVGVFGIGSKRQLLRTVASSACFLPWSIYDIDVLRLLELSPSQRHAALLQQLPSRVQHVPDVVASATFPALRTGDPRSREKPAGSRKRPRAEAVIDLTDEKFDDSSVESASGNDGSPSDSAEESTDDGGEKGGSASARGRRSGGPCSDNPRRWRPVTTEFLRCGAAENATSGSYFPHRVPSSLVDAVDAKSEMLLFPGVARWTSQSVRAHGRCASTRPNVVLLVVHDLDRLWSSAAGLHEPARLSQSALTTEKAAQQNACAFHALCALRHQLQDPSCASSTDSSPSSGLSLRLLFSFEDPDALQKLPRSFLADFTPELVQLCSPHLRFDWSSEVRVVYGESAVAAASTGASRPREKIPDAQFWREGLHLTDAAAKRSSGGSAKHSGGKLRLLPMGETVHRVLVSLPEIFRTMLSLSLQYQLEEGEDVFLSVSSLLERLQTVGGLFVTHARMRPFLQELSSNRIAVYEPSRHAVVLLQPTVLKQALDAIVKPATAGISRGDA